MLPVDPHVRDDIFGDIAADAGKMTPPPPVASFQETSPAAWIRDAVTGDHFPGILAVPGHGGEDIRMVKKGLDKVGLECNQHGSQPFSCPQEAGGALDSECGTCNALLLQAVDQFAAT